MIDPESSSRLPVELDPRDRRLSGDLSSGVALDLGCWRWCWACCRGGGFGLTPPPGSVAAIEPGEPA